MLVSLDLDIRVISGDFTNLFSSINVWEEQRILALSHVAVNWTIGSSCFLVLGVFEYVYLVAKEEAVIVIVGLVLWL